MSQSSSVNPMVLGPISGADPSSAQLGTTASSKLTAHTMYSGVVASTNLTTHTMSVDVNGYLVTNCVHAAGAVAGYMGFTTVTLPPAGAQVLLLYTPAASYVFGTQPRVYDPPTVPAESISGVRDKITGSDDPFADELADGEKAQYSPGYVQPRDVLPGERVESNNMGVTLRMLYNLEQLSAGDLAKIEVHLLNDMVRIVDNYFVHHHVGGDELIWSNGRTNGEDHFTSYPHEAEGKVKEDDPLAEMNGDTADVGAPEESTSTTGRWRLSAYRGFLADMIHTVVTDPTAAASSLGEEAHRAGKYRSWVGADGTVMIQSTASVHVEVTPRIVIPTMHTQWNDPAIDSAKMVEDLDKQFLKMWGEGPKWSDLSVACWQMRSYAKYITLWHSLQRYRQLEKKKGCTIQTEAECPAPSPTCLEEDKAQANPTADTAYNAHAIFSMDPSGSISMIANGTTSVILNQGNIQLATPGNIEINAGGTLTLTGRDVTVKALHNVELSALAGKMILKARTALQALCEAGRLWLKSDAALEASKNKSKVKGAYPVEGGTPIDPESSDFGIVLDAADSGVLVHGAKRAVLGTTSPDSPVYVQATGGNSIVSVVSQTQVQIVANTKILMKTMRWAVSASVAKLMATTIKLGENVRIKGGMVDIKGLLTAQSVVASGYTGPNEHISEQKDMSKLQPDTSDDDSSGDDANNLSMKDSTYPIMEGELTTYTWRYPAWGVGTDVLNWRSLKASPLNDMLRTESDARIKYFDEVLWNRCRLIAAPRTDSTSMPWPGKAAQYFEFNSGEAPALGALWDTQFTANMIANSGKMWTTPVKLYFRKPKDDEEPTDEEEGTGEEEG